MKEDFPPSMPRRTTVTRIEESKKFRVNASHKGILSMKNLYMMVYCDNFEAFFRNNPAVRKPREAVIK